MKEQVVISLPQSQIQQIKALCGNVQISSVCEWLIDTNFYKIEEFLNSYLGMYI